MPEEPPVPDALAKFIGELGNIEGLQPRVVEILQRLHNDKALKTGPLLEALRAALREELSEDGEDTKN